MNDTQNHTIYDIVEDFPYYHLNTTYTEADIEDAKVI